MPKRYLNKAEILAARDVKFEDVATPEWAPDGSTPEEAAECVVRIRNLTGSGRGAFIKKSLKMKRDQDAEDAGAGAAVDFEIEMMLVCMTAINPDDNSLLFTIDDIKALGEKNADAISRCAAASQRLAGISKQAKEQATKN